MTMMHGAKRLSQSIHALCLCVPPLSWLVSRETEQCFITLLGDTWEAPKMNGVSYGGSSVSLEICNFYVWRALSNCRNNSLAINSTLCVCSCRRKAESLAAPLLARSLDGACQQDAAREHGCRAALGAQVRCSSSTPLFLSSIWCDSVQFGSTSRVKFWLWKKNLQFH